MTIPPQESTIPTARVFHGLPIHTQSLQPTTLTILPTPIFPTSPFLPSLLKTINTAFHTSQSTNPSLGLQKLGDRLTSTSEFLSNFPHPSSSFTLIIHPPSSSTVLATASIRPYHGPKADGSEPTRNTPFERNLPVREGCEEWELKLMCTAPEVQGRGLAEFMLGIVEMEVRRSFKERVERGEVEAGKRVRIVLGKVQELLGEFYERRGFERDYETWAVEGVRFRVVHMSKDVTDGTC